MRIAVHAFDGITMFHLAAPLLVFGEVGRLGLADGLGRPRVWTEDGRGIRTAEGLRIDDVARPRRASRTPTSWSSRPGRPTCRPAEDGLVERSSARPTPRGSRHRRPVPGRLPGGRQRCCSTGGSVVTHWAAAAQLAHRRPAVTSTPPRSTSTTATSSPPPAPPPRIDACLHIVRSQLGSAAAATVARHLVVAPHREGDQAQYVDRPMPEPGGVGPPRPDPRLGAGPPRPTTSPSTSSPTHAGMSRRNFTRRFAEVTGTTPARWVLARRLDEARTAARDAPPGPSTASPQRAASAAP